MQKLTSFFQSFISKIFVQALVIGVLTYIFPESFKLYFAVMCLILVFLMFYHRNIIISLGLMFLSLLPFQTPGKYYTFELIPPGNYSYEQPGLENGIPEGYGLIMTDFLAIWIGLAFLRQGVNKLKERNYRLNIISLYKHHKNFSLALILWLSSFILALFSSQYFSFFPFFSLFVLFQHMKILVAFFLVIYFLTQKKTIGTRILENVILSMVLLQCFTAGTQLLTQLSSFQSSSSFRPTYVVPDESVFSFRPSGSFSYHNQFAFVMALLIFSWLLLQTHKQTLKTDLKLSEMLSSRKLMLKNREHVFTYSIISLGFVFLLLSQSRVIWLVLLFGAVLFRRELFTLLNDLRSVLRTNIRVTIALVLCVVALIAMLLPRVIHSSLFFSEEGGGSLRIQMIQDGMPVLQSGPLLGYGVETSIYQLFQQVPKGYIQEFPFAIHNAYLQLAIEQGIIGMLLFFLPFIFVLRKILNTGQKLHSVSRKSMIVLIITVLGYYCLHPSYGRIEFPFLGLIMGILIYDLDSYQKNI